MHDGIYGLVESHKDGWKNQRAECAVPKRMERSGFEPISTEDTNELAKVNIQGGYSIEA